jgi:hypothetical protein
MTQTTGALSGRNCYLGIKVGVTTIADMSGYSNMVDPGDQSREVGDAFTFDGDTGIVTAGKRKPMDIKVAALYTEGAAEFYKLHEAAFTGASDVIVAWAPKGNTPGNLLFTSAAGKISSFTYPKMDAGDANPVPVGFTLHTPEVTAAAITT